MAYGQGIERGAYAYKDLWRVVLARAARAARLVSHAEADAPVTPQHGSYWCSKHGRMCEPPSSASVFLRRDSADAAARLAEFASLRTDATVTFVQGQVDAFKFPRADGILTAPPPFGLPGARTRQPEAYALLDLPDGDASAAGEATVGRGRAAQAAYVERVGRVLAGAVRAVPRGAPVVLVVVDRQRLYAEIVRQAGLDVEAVLVLEGTPRGQAVWVCRKG